MANSCDPNQTIVNLTYVTDLSDFVFNTREWIIYQIIWPCFILFGICTNASFIWTIINTPSLYTTTYKYLVNLAISDLLFLITNYTPRIVNYHESRPVRKSLPFIVNTFVFLLFYCSFGTVTLVTLERFLAICYPIKHHLLKGTRRTKKLISSMWCISLSLALLHPSLLFISGSISESICIIWPDAYADYPNQYTSSEQFRLPSYFILCVNYVLIFFLMILNNVLYFKIYCSLKGRNNKGLNSSSDLQHRQVAHMLIVNGIFFFMCWSFQIFTTPVVLIYTYLIEEYTPLSFIWGLLSEILFGLNACMNPVLYLITNERYRHAFVKVFNWSRNNSKSRTEVNTIELTNVNRI